MEVRANRQEAGNEGVTLYTLPNDILGKIIRGYSLSFRDKCSLELLNKQSHTVFSNLLLTEGLWGCCNLMSDLRLVENFDNKEVIMRWLSKRLPGFTTVICDTERCSRYYERLQGTTFVRDLSKTSKAREATTWLLTQLPILFKASSSKTVLHMAVTSEVAPMLLSLSTVDDNVYLLGWGHHVQDEFWDLLSERLVELSILLYGHYNIDGRDYYWHNDLAKRWQSMFAKLTNLTSLKISWSSWYDTNCVLDLPMLKSLHISHLNASDLTLSCPTLRSLALERWKITGHLSLEAPLEHLACKGDIEICVHEAFPCNNFLGLTSLRCHLWGARSQLIPDVINGILPNMSRLRTLDLVYRKGGLPLRLPASLQSISYYLESYWGPNDLQRFGETCRLPHLHSIRLVHWRKWKPVDQLALDEM